MRMLRTKPTRIELKREDLDEYEKVKKEREKVKKDGSLDQLAGKMEPTAPLTEAEKIAKVHERIGYQPDSVPSDGTVHMM